ncbi:pimeloyl-ACP methyl ester carboxylesterase [Streptacidiphilus sp. MAP12-20]|uniref:alpha/beta fold hydrolase n=1 Tax=Streptacidiphilus sp. MAP12-20 TaxID=3156299 RepID=UPI003512A04B
MTSKQQSAWSGMVTVDDTALAVTDTGGTGTPVVYLNGSYADQKPWRRLIADLGGDYRHITYDERARGKSQRASDYSFEACVRDLDAVLKARGVERPILVGWSYGGLIAMHWAARYPDRVAAVVSVDGAMPTVEIDDATREQVRNLFRKLSPLFPLLRPLGLAARMSTAQHAEINLELIDLCSARALAPVFADVTAPTRYIIGTGGNLGATEKEMEDMRTELGRMLDGNPTIQISKKVASNHSHILSKDFHSVADAVRELATARDHEVG